MLEMDLSVGTKEFLSDLLSNIKLGLRHEIQQRRQLQNELSELSQVVCRHERFIQRDQQHDQKGDLSQHHVNISRH